MKTSGGWIFLTCMVALCGVAILCGCPQRPMTDAELEAAFDAAVAMAHNPKPAYIARNLTGINGHNSGLVWEGEPGESRLLVTTWTAYDGYVVGKDFTVSGQDKYQPSVDLWVTCVPEARRWVRERKIRPADVELRLRQAMGMPHTTARKWFVEFWANPEDLFRPSPDPEITDHEAELDFPPDTLAMTISPLHKAWIENQIATNSWPWTRLGYTYDWGHPFNHVGLSEFIIRNGSTVTVASITPTQQYLYH